MVYTHVKSFTIVKNRKCGQVMSHCETQCTITVGKFQKLNTKISLCTT